MKNNLEKISILKISEDSGATVDDVVVTEFPLTIMLDNRELVTLLCSPEDVNYLAAGFLSSEGFIETKDDIKKIMVDERRGIVRVQTTGTRVENDDVMFKRMITSGCGRGASFYNSLDMQNSEKIESSLKVSAKNILSLVRDFQHQSQLYRETGGVHSAALCDTDKILVFNEDIGRHNALDKIFGECLLKDISTDERIVVSSGRISSEMLMKVARRNIPIIASKSAPTDLGIKMANELGITLLGFVRGKKMNVYTNHSRIMINNPITSA